MPLCVRAPCPVRVVRAVMQGRLRQPQAADGGGGGSGGGAGVASAPTTPYGEELYAGGGDEVRLPTIAGAGPGQRGAKSPRGVVAPVRPVRVKWFGPR